MTRPLVRVHFPDETAWGEHLGGNLYRCLNHTFDSVEAKFPEGHEHHARNGQKKNLRWGDIFEGEPLPGRPTVIKPLFVVGQDLSPRPEDPTDQA